MCVRSSAKNDSGCGKVKQTGFSKKGAIGRQIYSVDRVTKYGMSEMVNVGGSEMKSGKIARGGCRMIVWRVIVSCGMTQLDVSCNFKECHLGDVIPFRMRPIRNESISLKLSVWFGGPSYS
jgi:hypothetical protein